MELPVNFFVGIILGGIAGFALGFLVGMVSRPQEKKEVEKYTRARKLFDEASQEKDKKRKMKILGKILDRYPATEWADKALEEVMKLKKENK